MKPLKAIEDGLARCVGSGDLPVYISERDGIAPTRRSGLYGPQCLPMEDAKRLAAEDLITLIVIHRDLQPGPDLPAFPPEPEPIDERQEYLDSLPGVPVEKVNYDRLKELADKKENNIRYE